jgi:ATP-dependent Clp protease ATP-binding subunit ClpX
MKKPPPKKPIAFRNRKGRRKDSLKDLWDELKGIQETLEHILNLKEMVEEGGLSSETAISSRKHPSKNSSKNNFPLPSPDEIKKHLDDYVVSQDETKKVLSVAIYNHFKRLKSENSDTGVEISKSNVLIMGPTGSGKTLMIDTIAKKLGLPFYSCAANDYSETGYVGGNIEDILSNLIENADGDIGLAEKGIVYIDEIDKIRRSGETRDRDVSGAGVQRLLLKMIEGTKMKVPVGPDGDMCEIDTKNILFVCGGAFVGLDKIINRRLNSSPSIGFGKEIKTRAERKLPTATLLAQVQTQDLQKFGIIPELIGRLPVISVTESLDADALKKVLTEPKNSLVQQFQALARMDGFKLTFTPEAYDAIAEMAIKHGTGGRSLRAIMEKALMNIHYNVSDYKKRNTGEIIVGADVIKGTGGPELIERQEPRLGYLVRTLPGGWQENRYP